MHASHSTSAFKRKAQAAGGSFVGSHAFELFSRAGFVARGLVYAIIGILALELALGQGGKLTNQRGALQTVAHQPFGKVLLTLIAVGIGGYALWALVRAAIGHGPEGSDSGGQRIAAGASGITYGAICAIAVTILLDAGGGSGESAKSATAGVFSWPAGTWLVGIAGGVTIAVALYQGYVGVSKKFLENSKTEEMGRRTKRWIGGIGMIGHLARMVVFGLVGVFLIKAAADDQARAAVGLDGVLAKLLHRSYGPFALGLVAAGLVAFALYSLSDARYRRI
jgi:hypothetical protein